MEVKRKTLHSILNQMGFIEDQCRKLAEKLEEVAMDDQADYFEELSEELAKRKAETTKTFEKLYFNEME